MRDRDPANIDPAIASFYDRASEESRLQQGSSLLESARTRELIERHAPPPPADIVDVGGAAGVYAFWLAERGYAVRLVDASPRLVALAEQRNAEASRPLVACRVGDARTLPLADASMDLVLLLGPLYHLVEASDRRAALAEAMRVLRPAGVLLAAGISRYASALDGLSRDLLADPSFERIVARDVAEGQHRNPTQRLDYFTTAYLHRPEDLRDEIEAAGFIAVGLYGIEGPGWLLPDFESRWAHPARRAALLHVARLLESEPSVLGASAHLLVAARKAERGVPPEDGAG